VQCPQDTARTLCTFGTCTLLYLAPHSGHSKFDFRGSAIRLHYRIRAVPHCPKSVLDLRQLAQEYLLPGDGSTQCLRTGFTN
jgi:hypothetical protein